MFKIKYYVGPEEVTKQEFELRLNEKSPDIKYFIDHKAVTKEEYGIHINKEDNNSG